MQSGGRGKQKEAYWEGKTWRVPAWKIYFINAKSAILYNLIFTSAFLPPNLIQHLPLPRLHSLLWARGGDPELSLRRRSTSDKKGRRSRRLSFIDDSCQDVLFFFSLWRWQIESVMCTRRRWIMHPELPCSHSAACIHRAETDSDNFPSLRRIQKCVKRRRTKMPGKVIFRPTWFCAFRELLSSEGEVCFWRGSEIQVCFQAATSDLLYRVYLQQPGPLLHLPPIIRYSPVMLFTEHWLFFLFLFGPLSHLREREKREGQREERGKRKKQ